MAFQEASLAAGWNNAGSLANIETTFGFYMGSPFIAFMMPISEGDPFERGNARLSSLGKMRFQWRFAGMTVAQYELARTTYCSNGYSGPVTVRTLKKSSYANYSATLQLAHEDELDLQPGGVYLNPVWKFVIEAAL
jgi:hypothetical protein